jgi:hypothetical protein
MTAVLLAYLWLPPPPVIYPWEILWPDTAIVRVC